MSLYGQTILRGLGLLLHVPGLMALATLPVCLYFDERYAIAPFLWTAGISFAVGEAFYHLCQRAEAPRLHHGMVVAALGWLLVPLLGAVPILWIAHRLAALPDASLTVLAFTSPWNALFEAFSGFTGTGLSMALRESQLPASLQWWRSLMEWVGGVGVIVLMLSLLRHVLGVRHLYSSEAREEKILPSVTSTARTIWWIYLFYTTASVLLLRAAGMPWWEALNHGMTGIATGGFSVTDGSMASYGTGVRLLLLLIMVAGAISFVTHYQVLRHGRLSALWRDAQHKALWLILAAGAVLLLLENRWYGGESVWLDSVFQWASALTTAGFQTVDLLGWSPTAKLLLSLAMILGGVAGSTCGGLKLLRVVTLYRGLRWRFQRVSLTRRQLMRYQVDGEALSETEADRLVRAAGVLAALWATLLWAAVLFLLHIVPHGFTLSDVILEVASAQSNVGLSTGITHPTLLWPAKLTLILVMWMGRLEIIPVFILGAALAGGGRGPLR
ncbi:MAG: TrkH family potassium uptake protein [Candidatus Acidoferrales bacterium]